MVASQQGMHALPLSLPVTAAAAAAGGLIVGCMAVACLPPGCLPAFCLPMVGGVSLWFVASLPLHTRNLPCCLLAVRASALNAFRILSLQLLLITIFSTPPSPLTRYYCCCLPAMSKFPWGLSRGRTCWVDLIGRCGCSPKPTRFGLFRIGAQKYATNLAKSRHVKRKRKRAQVSKLDRCVSLKIATI